MIRALAVSIVLCMICVPIQAAIRVNVRFEPVANLVYQLDCVSGSSVQCSRQTLEALWHERFLKTDDDRKALAEWAAIQDKYDTNAELRSHGSEPPSRYRGISPLQKLRAASQQARSMNDYFERLELVVLPSDRARLEAVFRHFWPAFESWWRLTANAKGRVFAAGTERLLERKEIRERLSDFARFYGAVIPQNYALQLNLFFRPDSSEPTSGGQVESFSTAEFLPDEKPEERVDVIIHEICHFLFDSSSDAAHEKLSRAFREMKGPSAIGAWNLLNEGLATAFGNAMINKRLMSPKRWESYIAREQSLYNDAAIDGAARATWVWLADWIKAGRTLSDPEFASEWVRRLGAALGKRLEAPSLQLKTMTVIIDSKLKSGFTEHIHATLRPSSFYGVQKDLSSADAWVSFTSSPDRNALVVIQRESLKLTAERIGLSKDQLKALQKAAGEADPVIMSYSRNGSSRIFMIVASDTELARKGLERLAAKDEGFDGRLP